MFLFILDMVFVILLLGINGKFGCIWYRFCINSLFGKFIFVVLIFMIICFFFIFGFVMFLNWSFLSGLKDLYIIVFILFLVVLFDEYVIDSMICY